MVKILVFICVGILIFGFIVFLFLMFRKKNKNQYINIFGFGENEDGHTSEYVFFESSKESFIKKGTIIVDHYNKKYKTLNNVKVIPNRLCCSKIKFLENVKRMED